MGFTTDQKNSYSSVLLDVFGMKCNSCVKKITGHLMNSVEKIDGIDGIDGIFQVSIDLNSKSALIFYDGTKIDQQKICERINGLGFEARIRISDENQAEKGDKIPSILTENSSSDSDKNETKTYTVSIEGMVCQSCVKNIEGTMGQKPGIQSIKVNLEEKRGVVKFETKFWTAEKVAEEIDQMGFEAIVLGEGRGKI